MVKSLTHFDACSGIGGFALAGRNAGFKQIGFCEIDPFCRKVLAKHWPDVPCHQDLKKLSGEPYRGTVNLFTAGIPCQPYSLAGEQRGSDDDRALWPEAFRFIQECRPHWFVGENVIGFIKLELDRAIADLESEGYSVRTFNIPACAIQAAHERKRVWIVANLESLGRGERDIRESFPNAKRGYSIPDSFIERIKIPIEWILPAVEGLHCDNFESVSDINGARRKELDLPSKPGFEGKSSGGADSHRRSEGCSPEPGILRGFYGVPAWLDRSVKVNNYQARIKGLGNAIVPQVAYQILSAIAQIERGECYV